LTDLEIWSQKHFGPNRGLAQLLLFHWFRNRPKTPSSPAPTRRLRLAS
jgi:hypothetical protein